MIVNYISKLFNIYLNIATRHIYILFILHFKVNMSKSSSRLFKETCSAIHTHAD